MVSAIAPTILEESPYSADSPVNSFAVIQQYVDIAADVLGLEPARHTLLREPAAELTVTLPLRLDRDTTRVVKAFRVHHSNARGPSKGGIRCHPAETLDAVRAMAAWSNWQAAVCDLPLGGAAGGMACNPRTLSPTECTRLHEAYREAVTPLLDAERHHAHLPGAYVYTPEQIDAWLMDEFSPGMHCGVASIARDGGLARHDAAARGSLFAVQEAAHLRGIDLHGATAAIQGYGQAGRVVHRLAESMGLRVVAVSDTRGGVYYSPGLVARALGEHKQRTGSVGGFRGTREIDNAVLLELPVTVLILAAAEDQVTGSNAGQVKAAIVAELAQHAINTTGDHALHAQGRLVIPDILCAAGTLLASYAELAHGRPYTDWNEAARRTYLTAPIARALDEIDRVSREHDVNARLAAYMVALEREAQAVG
jgi:glutamate dehydrogenase (NAD(P)+)